MCGEPSPKLGVVLPPSAAPLPVVDAAIAMRLAAQDVGPPASRLKGAKVSKLSRRGGREARADDAPPSVSASVAHDNCAKERAWLLSKVEEVAKSWSTSHC